MIVNLMKCRLLNSINTVPVILTIAMLLRLSGPAYAVESDSSQVFADRILKSKIPVLIDFWAPWCKPCHMLTPVVTQISKDYAGKIKVMKVNVDIHRQMASYFKVTSIPAIFIVKDKTVVKYMLGVQPKKAYIDAIQEVLAMKETVRDSVK